MRREAWLDPETAVEIYFAKGRQKAIARKYGITATTVSRIKNRINYRAATAAWDPKTGAEMMSGMLSYLACTGRAM
jgi:DNA invertase Pin-like site-specific DNA recombinase